MGLVRNSFYDGSQTKKGEVCLGVFGCVWAINNENFSFLILLFYFILIDFHAIPEFFLVKWIVLERIQCLGGG